MLFRGIIVVWCETLKEEVNRIFGKNAQCLNITRVVADGIRGKNV